MRIPRRARILPPRTAAAEAAAAAAAAAAVAAAALRAAAGRRRRRSTRRPPLPSSLPYKVDTSRPSLRTKWTRLAPLQDRERSRAAARDSPEGARAADAAWGWGPGAEAVVGVGVAGAVGGGDVAGVVAQAPEEVAGRAAEEGRAAGGEEAGAEKGPRDEASAPADELLRAFTEVRASPRPPAHGPFSNFLSAAACSRAAPPTSRTNRTRRVPRPVLIGHAASLTPY
jgi:hypothetical protein